MELDNSENNIWYRLNFQFACCDEKSASLSNRVPLEKSCLDGAEFSSKYSTIVGFSVLFHLALIVISKSIWSWSMFGIKTNNGACIFLYLNYA